MHQQIADYVEEIKETYPDNFCESTVLEIGSLNINGTVRKLFDNCNYTGVDIMKGPRVDVVCEGQNFDDPDESFDTVISCECFEHNPYWRETFLNMYRLCKKGGLMLITCATEGRAEHGTRKNAPAASPFTVIKGWNYYQNLTDYDFYKSFDLNRMFKEYEFSTIHEDWVHDLRFYGVK